MPCTTGGGEIGVIITRESGVFVFNEVPSTAQSGATFDTENRTLTITALGTYTMSFMASGFTFLEPTITQPLSGVTVTLISETEVQATNIVTQCGGSAQECKFILHADISGDDFGMDPTIINNAQPSGSDSGL